VRRRQFFLAAGATLALAPGRIVAQSADPESSAPAQSLRVLLGYGEAQPAPDGFLFNGKPYRGSFTRLPDGRVVNVVGLEEYLYSVVPREMPSRWPPAALQAQAICARTYVLERSNPQREYDLTPSQAAQVYDGLAAETPAARAAVDASSGLVLRYRRRYAQTPYSSCCGGHTEASADAWGGPPVPYLGGVVCSYCSPSPNFRWSTGIGLDRIAQQFSAALASSGALDAVGIAGVDASGRARAFELFGQTGSVLIKGETFRLGLGTRVLRSLLITSMTKAGTTVLIEGGGLGHGVGMCQWGARGMALAALTAREILMFYFPGTEIGTLDG
jgi:stage II sporulation protein D